MARLLILSCSQRKRTALGLVPAIERYDGPAFRVLRKYLTGSETTPPSTYILSAEYGLLPSDTPIPHYDRRMTRARAALLRPSVQRKLEHIVATSAPALGEVFICASSPYLSALGIYARERDHRDHVENVPIDDHGDERLLATAWLAHGSIGKRMADLRDWLYGAPPPSVQVNANAHPEPVVFRGVALNLSARDVLHIASEQARQDPAGAARFEAWYVSAGAQRVAPKWLVHVLTGVPLGAFGTLEARRLLARLGVEVTRV